MSKPPPREVYRDRISGDSILLVSDGWKDSDRVKIVRVTGTPEEQTGGEIQLRDLKQALTRLDLQKGKPVELILRMPLAENAEANSPAPLCMVILAVAEAQAVRKALGPSQPPALASKKRQKR